VRYLEVPVDNAGLKLGDDADRRLMIPVRSVQLDVEDERVLVPALESSRLGSLRGRVDLGRESFGASAAERATARARPGLAERELETGRADLSAERDLEEGRSLPRDGELHTDLAARVRALENRVSDGTRRPARVEEGPARRRPVVREELVLVRRTIKDGKIEETDVQRERIDRPRPDARGRAVDDTEPDR
jgi:hypothetical protein